jgi:hypothetical protein
MGNDKAFMPRLSAQNLGKTAAGANPVPTSVEHLAQPFLRLSSHAICAF